MEPITPKQKQVFEFIQSFEAAQGFAPSQNEIAKHFGFKSLGTVQDYLNRLSKSGFIARPRYGTRAARAIASPEQAQHTTHANDAPAASAEIPLLGRIAAGRPLEAIAEAREIGVPPMFLEGGERHFALIANGDSMIEDGILDGDYLVVRSQETADNGDIVVALIDQEATIKRIFRQRGRTELHPANPRYMPILVDPSRDFRIQGVLVGVFRHLG
jgi:repressor LexA